MNNHSYCQFSPPLPWLTFWKKRIELAIVCKNCANCLTELLPAIWGHPVVLNSCKWRCRCFKLSSTAKHPTRLDIFNPSKSTGSNIICSNVIHGEEFSSIHSLSMHMTCICFPCKSTFRLIVWGSYAWTIFVSFHTTLQYSVPQTSEMDHMTWSKACRFSMYHFLACTILKRFSCNNFECYMLLQIVKHVSSPS